MMDLNKLGILWTERKYRFRLLVVLAILFIYFFYNFIVYHLPYSRDAYVYAHTINVNAQVPGHVEKLFIKDNQAVKKGQLLFTLDKRPYEYAVQQAMAELKQAKIEYKNIQTRINSVMQALQQKQDLFQLAKDHKSKYLKLGQTGAISEIKVLDIIFKTAALSAEVRQAQSQLLIAKQSLTLAQVERASAVLKKAQYNLNHAAGYAATDGLVTNFNLRVGDYVKRGQSLFALIDTSRWWVITRYRETVLRKIKPGDKVRVHIDMYPNKTFHGTVDSIGWGINREQASKSAAISSLPYLEATEYWIRIAQRFPVRILITDVNPKYPLRVGANAKTYVL